MRRILVERAKRREKRAAGKAGGGISRLDADEVQPADQSQPDQLLVAVNDVLETLAEEDECLAVLVKLHLFVGFSLPEAAEAMGIGRSTVYEHWVYAISPLKVSWIPSDRQRCLIQSAVVFADCPPAGE